ncbi:MAG: DUF4136 domain-containing protein [Candidatus Krumholzibacteria bacterium]|nr:DUF4136 domain-containing protein [Candidatus Krumholzibacteria bacterium]
MFAKLFKSLVPTTLIFVLLWALGGCSSMSVTYDYDNNVTWEGLKTYAWLASTNEMSENPAKDSMSGGLLDKRIRAAVDWEMEQRGIKTGDDPDLLIKYYLGAEQKVQVTDWGYRYSDYYWGYGGRQIDVYQFTQGTLVIDIIDAKTKALIWRGTATDTVDEGQRSPEETEARVNDVVNKILANFPPK